MECEGMRFWTFSGLVGAFLDLAIAYSLLCAATLAYLASNFLGVFGLSLPCPCDGFFGNPNGGGCVRTVLADQPSEKICSVQLSVKKNFPFDAVFINDRDCEMILEPGEERMRENRHVQLEGEASCSSYAERSERDIGVRGYIARNELDSASGAVDLLLGEEERFDFKGKGVLSQRTKVLRRRQKRSVEREKFSSVCSYDPWQADAQDAPSPSSMRKLREGSPEESFFCAESQINCAQASDERDALTESALRDSEKTADLDGDKEKNLLAFEEFGAYSKGQSDFEASNKDTVRTLEQQLEEERSARHALWLELEKERNAAATAADEAMAMILRLQADKASIDMEARQYQRMIEEKSAYDAEEMNILKEILLRRERERHFLEKELESYRQIIFPNERLDDDLNETVAPEATRTFSNGDPGMMLQCIGESLIKKGKPEAKNDPGFQIHFVPLQNCNVDFERESQFPEWLEDDKSPRASCTSGGQPVVDISDLHLADNEINQEVKEKVMLSTDNKISALQGDLPSQIKQFSSQGFGFLVETDEKENKLLTVNSSLSKCLVSEINETLRGSHMNLPLDGGDMETDGRFADIDGEVSKTLGYGMEPCVHDVHVISDQPPSGHSKEVKSDGAKLTKNASLNILTSSERLVLDNQGSGLDMNGSSSDVPMVSLQGQALPSYLRRNSMSAVDYERLKIDNEVGWLRERLKIVQEGRERLSLLGGNRGRGKNEFQLLENIVSELRGIREMTGYGKAERQSSLPPPSLKVSAKKRRWRSASLGVNRST